MTDVIYQPKGRAGEYGALACNLFSTCPHACTYCYVPSVLRTTSEAFHQPAVPRKDIMRQLEKDARKRQARGEGGQVFLCFTCDPYPAEDMEPAITRRAIEILHDTGHTVRVLTKGGTRALRDLDLFGPGDAFGVTLTCISPSNSEKWEPGAALPSDRITALREFHKAGIPTWVSLE
ncbi:MAG: radical SAM protein, partial [Armatimonadota bacterium]